MFRSIRLHFGGSTQTGRGLASVFIVKYEWEEGQIRDFEITVFRKMAGNYWEFVKQVQVQNPSVEVKNWFTSLDPIIRLFRKRD